MLLSLIRIGSRGQGRQNIKFDGVSESRSQFTAKERALEEAPKDVGPAEKWWEKTKFTGASESHAQFVPKPLEKSEGPPKEKQAMVRSFSSCVCEDSDVLAPVGGLGMQF